jgi:hypothetical protein
MADFLVPECSAENVVVYDTDRKRRRETCLAVSRRLAEQGWTLHVFAAEGGDAYGDLAPGRVVARAALTADDVAAVTTHGPRTAVLIDGLSTAAGAPMRRLLKSKGTFVLAASDSKDVRGDHRYGRVWTPGRGWRLREEPKDFTVIEAPQAPAAEPQGWLGWLGW